MPSSQHAPGAGQALGRGLCSPSPSLGVDSPSLPLPPSPCRCLSVDCHCGPSRRRRAAFIACMPLPLLCALPPCYPLLPFPCPFPCSWLPLCLCLLPGRRRRAHSVCGALQLAVMAAALSLPLAFPLGEFFGGRKEEADQAFPTHPCQLSISPDGWACHSLGLFFLVLPGAFVIP